MIPETTIINAIVDLWVEKFPEGDSTVYPKGLVRRISQNPIREKDNIVSGKYETRINIEWQDVNTTNFESKMTSIITTMGTLPTSETKIKNVIYEGSDFGYNDEIDIHIMNLEFIIKHYI